MDQTLYSQHFDGFFKFQITEKNQICFNRVNKHWSVLPHYLQRSPVILLLRTGHPFECCSQLLFVILCSPTTWCFRCTQLLSHAAPDVKMLG